MKIIYKGTLPDKQKYEVRCYKCNSIIEFEKDEGIITFDQRDGNFITFTCPICNKPINVTI